MAAETERMTYLGVAPCGCIRMAIADDPDIRKTVAQSIGEAVMGGLTVERVPSHTLRERTWRVPDCPTHPAPPKVERTVQESFA